MFTPIDVKKTAINSHYVSTVNGLPVVRNFGINRQYYACECGDGQGAINAAIKIKRVPFYNAAEMNSQEASQEQALRHYVVTNDWRGEGLHPMTETGFKPGEIKTKGDACHCGQEYFISNNSRFVTEGLAVNLLPIKYKTLRENNIADMPALAALESAGIYMPDINLHKGFSFVCSLARDTVKRELVKKEIKPLFAAYVKAANRYQLVCLPDKSAMPFFVCAGNVWDSTAGSIARFSLLAEKALGRPMTFKEGVFIKAQWPAITAARRASASRLDASRNDKDFVSGSRTMGEIWKKGSEYTKNFVLAHAEGNRSDANKGALIFNYRQELQRIKDRLKTGGISHAVYNEQLKELKNRHKKQQEVLDDIAKRNIRHEFKNSNVIHVVRNDQGYSQEKASNASKRFAYDDYPIGQESDDSDDNNDFLMIDNMKSPTVWRDGSVSNADSRKPIIIKRKRRTIAK